MFVQVIVFVTGLRVTDGAPALGEICTVEVAEHPLIGFVAVSVYTPAPQAEVIELVVDPQILAPAHRKVVLVGVVTLPFKVTEPD